MSRQEETVYEARILLFGFIPLWRVKHTKREWQRLIALQLGIIYFEGSFSEGNDKRAVYEYEDTYTIAIEVDMSKRLICF